MLSLNLSQDTTGQFQSPVGKFTMENQRAEEYNLTCLASTQCLKQYLEKCSNSASVSYRETKQIY
jgi:hypothetical protein